MIRHLRHKEINREKWDACIDNASFKTIYPHSWYLDLVSPGWEGLVIEDYSAVMPLTISRRSGMDFLLQPILAQQLGLFSPEDPGSGLMNDIRSFLKKQYRYIDINLNLSNTDAVKGFADSWRTNHELDLKQEKNYNTNTKRNLSKGLEHGMEIREINPLEYIGLKSANEKKLAVTESYLENLFAGLKNLGHAECIGLFQGEELQAGAVLAFSGPRAIYLNGTSSDKGKELRAMFVLMDHLIEYSRDRFEVFDFEGSMIEGIARFFEGFGAIKTQYPGFRIRKFPFSLLRK